MKVEGIDPATGKKVENEIEEPERSFFEEMCRFDVSDDAIRRMIDKLNISADYKSLLYTLAKSTIKVGDYIIKVGRKILDAICHTIKEFPNATFGLVFGGIAGLLISSIPILGQILGPVVTPILMVYGLGTGRLQDIQNKNLERTIAASVAEFSPLAA